MRRAGGDRRRPLARFSARDVAALHADGAITPDSTVAVLSEAGAARACRAEAAPSLCRAAWRDRERAVIDADGDLRTVRGRDPNLSCRGCARDTARARLGRAMPNWVRPPRLCADWQRSQAGVVRGSD
ncbi:MAG: hypothetical protein R3C16_12780 [Hyphomonadaceae bacterium]